VVKDIPHYLQIKVDQCLEQNKVYKRGSLHVGYMEQGYGGKLLESQGG
jgi:hypothetical protein